MTDLLALAERIEQAEGPDRELDWEIAKALGRSGHYLTLEQWSSSIDAAFSLVPEHWQIGGITQRSYRGAPYRLTLDRYGDYAETDETSVAGNSMDFALALVAASLRARHAEGGDDV